jgi:Spy/CpxP family protein refolding chaperone
VKSLAGALLLASLAGSAAASPANLPEGKWWKNPRVVAEINLTNDQVREIEDIFERARPKLIDSKGELEKREGDLQEAIESNVDRRDIAAKVDAVEKARAELQKTRILMVLDMRQTLKGEQWERLVRMHQEFRRERRERFGRFLERRRSDRPR